MKDVSIHVISSWMPVSKWQFTLGGMATAVTSGTTSAGGVAISVAEEQQSPKSRAVVPCW